MGLNFLAGQYYTLLRIAFDNAIIIRNSGASVVFIYILEISWVIDILVNLVKVTPKMK